MSAPSPAELLALARAAMRPWRKGATAEDRGPEVVLEARRAGRRLYGILEEDGPAVIAALCERLQRYSPNLIPHPMTAPLEVREG